MPERCVYHFEAEPGHSITLLVTGTLDAAALEALKFYCDLTARELARTKDAEACVEEQTTD